uniref:F-box only protein 21-like n=1 Tax=Geotrypetes seraphini TaxID=260995 RepID=A0A6P8R8Q1_GEOSA|nr:F-box only protein 21-like [Geotrypetes seraphini]
MPRLNTVTVFRICLVLSAIPIQYFISQYYGLDSAECLQIMQRMARFCSHVKSYLDLNVWTDQVKEWMSNARIWFYGDSTEKEDDNTTYFAESTDIRSPKPASVRLSVGQVMIHKKLGYTGVIIGWDAKVRAPEDWLIEEYGSEVEERRNMPHYRILISLSKKYNRSISYITEDQITIIQGFKINHPAVHIYFTMFDGSRYVMHPWLQRVYPHD